MNGETGRPAPWERERGVHSVALALEAAGCPPARPDAAGYTAVPGPEPGTVRLTWTGAGARQPDPLGRMAALLADRGWQSTSHRTREGAAYLLVSPRR
jgi:hypothetical protein